MRTLLKVIGTTLIFINGSMLLYSMYYYTFTGNIFFVTQQRSFMLFIIFLCGGVIFSIGHTKGQE